MGVKKIYLVRHGQTDYNLKGIVQGGTIDASLNGTGRAQAEAFFDAYRNIKFDHIYTSTLKRSIESVQAFIDLKIPVTHLSGLNEISWGDYDGQKIYDGDYYWDVVESWRNGDVSVRIKNGESPEDVAKRQLESLAVIHNDGHETILICMHGRAMRILLCQLTHTPLKNMDQFKHHNLGLYELDVVEDDFKVTKINQLDHLEGKEGLIVAH